MTRTDTRDTRDKRGHGSSSDATLIVRCNARSTAAQMEFESSQQSSRGGSSQQSRRGGDDVSGHQRERWVRRLQMATFIAVSFSDDDGATAHIEQTDTALALRKHKLFRENLRRYTHNAQPLPRTLAPLKYLLSFSSLELAFHRVLQAKRHVKKLTLCVERSNDIAQEARRVHSSKSTRVHACVHACMHACMHACVLHGACPAQIHRLSPTGLY